MTVCKQPRRKLRGCCYLLTFQLGYYNFRSVVEADRNDTVAHASTDDHSGVFFIKLASIILGEEPLVGSHQAAHKGQTELPAMGMAAEYQIHTRIYIGIEQLRSMG